MCSGVTGAINGVRGRGSLSRALSNYFENDGRLPMRRSKELFISAMAGLIMLFSAPAFTQLVHLREAGVAGELLPSIFPLSYSFEPDVQVGTIIYDASVESGEISQSCDDDSVRVRRGYLSLSGADARVKMFYRSVAKPT